MGLFVFADNAFASANVVASLAWLAVNAKNIKITKQISRNILPPLQISSNHHPW
jgi:hypothetical protein